MRVLSIATGATPTQISAGGHYAFAHIYNDSDTTIYIGYDGDAASVDVNKGYPLLPTGLFTLENYGTKELFMSPIYAVHGAGVGKNVRVQGV